MNRPHPTSGLRHVALFVHNFEASERFFVEIMGMSVEWRPDADNVYLTSGNDNLALHRSLEKQSTGKLDHVGFFIRELDQVDVWCGFLKTQQVEIINEPRTHRDGARSFYCQDPSGVKVQIIYHPPIAASES